MTLNSQNGKYRLEVVRKYDREKRNTDVHGLRKGPNDGSMFHSVKLWDSELKRNVDYICVDNNEEFFIRMVFNGKDEEHSGLHGMTLYLDGHRVPARKIIFKRALIFPGLGKNRKGKQWTKFL